MREIVDTHHHLWDFTRHRYEWLHDGRRSSRLGDYSGICRSFTCDDLVHAYAERGIVKSVFVEADWGVEGNAVDETEWAAEQCARSPMPNAFVAFADLTRPDVDRVLARHAEFPVVKGIRARPASADALSSRAFRTGLEHVRRLGLIFAFTGQWTDMAEMAQLAAQMPDLTVLINHLGQPLERGTEYFERWRSGLRLLAAEPNTVLQASEFGLGERDWTARSMTPWVREGIEVFGPDRVVFGSDWPVCTVFRSLDYLIAAWAEFLEPYSEAETDAIMRRNAEQLFGI